VENLDGTETDKMTRVLQILAAVVLLSAVPERLAAQAPLQRVIVTYSSRSIASIDLYVAQERGFFREEGLDPQLVQVRATAAIAAAVSGETHALGSIGSDARRSARSADQGARGQPAATGLLAREPPGTSKVFDFSLQREVNQELRLK
jgi:hypothetical protein